MDWMKSMKKMPERSPAVGRRLHNFILPDNLKWGNRRVFRCEKVEVDDDEEIPANHHHRNRRRGFDSRVVDFEGGSDSSSLKKRRRRERLIYDPSFVDSDFRRRQFGGDFNVKATDRKFKYGGGGGDGGDEGNGIAAVAEKIISEFRIDAGKLIWKEEFEEAPPPPPSVVKKEEEGRYFRNNSSSPEKPDALECAAGEAKRVAAIQTVKVSEFDENKKNHQIRLRNGGGGGVGGGGATTVKEEVVKFSASLSKSEIEEDFVALSGRRPPRKPKKRPRSVQNYVDFLTPGVWLTEVKTRRRYEVCHNRSKV